MPKILLVEDDGELASKVREVLELDRHTVEQCRTGADALEKLRFFSYDLIVLDWNLPDVEGIEIVRAYRNERGLTPILMITGRTDVADIEAGLVSGCDDYLGKPFNPRELMARIKALLRRTTKQYTEVIKIGRLQIDVAKYQVHRDGERIHLQPKEFSLLAFLAQNPDEAFSVDVLLKRIWESDSDASPDTVRVCITRLRNKIDTEGEPSIIRTVHRIGYQIEPAHLMAKVQKPSV